jgi:hypothetical protein
MPVARDHKFHFEGCYILHDDCANPTMRVLVESPDPHSQELLPQHEENSSDAA